VYVVSSNFFFDKYEFIQIKSLIFSAGCLRVIQRIRSPYQSLLARMCLLEQDAAAARSTAARLQDTIDQLRAAVKDAAAVAQRAQVLCLSPAP
jgi:hypothetical protein